MINFKKRFRFVCLLISFLIVLEISPCPPLAFARHSQTADMHDGVPIDDVTPLEPQPKTEEKDIPPNNPSDDNEKLDPVYVDIGEFHYTHQDISIPSRGLPIDITRIYRSQREFNGRFGYGWFFNFYIQIKKLSNNNMLILDGSNGRKIEFIYNQADGSYTSPAGIYDTLEKNIDGTYTLTKKNGAKYNFDINGNLNSIVDRNQNQIDFTYDIQGKLPIIGHSEYFVDLVEGVIAYDYMLTKITDSAGREINFIYNDNGRLITITDFATRCWTYNYDENDNLASFTTPATAEYPEGLTTTYTYDAQHNLLSIIDPKGQTYITNHYDDRDKVDWQTYGSGTAYISYDDVNDITTVTDRKGYITEWAYNDNGNPIAKTAYTSSLRSGDPASYTTTYEYNSNMERTKVIYPKGNWVKYTYDNKGNLLEIRRKKIAAPDEPDLLNDIVTTFTYEPNFSQIKSITAPGRNITTYTYDYEGYPDTYPTNCGNLMKITYPSVAAQTIETQFTYNTYGQVETATDPNGNVTKYEYYPATGYLKKIIQGYGALNYVTEMGYDDVGNVTSIIDPRSNTTTFEYNALNQLTKTISPTPFNYETKYSYDENGNLKQVDRQTGNSLNPWQTTTYTYTILDKLASLTDDLSHTTYFDYDLNENRSSITDAEGNITEYVYDERDLLWKTIQVNEGQQYITEYAYDDNGNLKEIKDVRSNRTTYQYDDFDRLTLTNYQDGTTESYTYDAAGNLKTKTDQKDQTIEYDYDELNRLTLKTYPDLATVDYVYDTASRLIDVIDATGTIHYVYDEVNRVEQVTYPGAITAAYQYDANGNRTRLTYPGSSYITYWYDELNRLTDIKDSASQVIAHYDYDALFRRTELDYANSTQATYYYDAINRLETLTNTFSPTPKAYSYTYDNVGNRLTMQTAEGTHGYIYDDIYQLTSVTYPDASSTTYNYDKAGNRTSRVNGGTTEYTPNEMNQYDLVGRAPYTYDDNGNLTNNGINSYGYDYENRLISATTPAHAATYTYDAFGRRVQKDVDGTITNFIYDGDQVILETNSTGATQAKYIYGPGIDEPILMERGGETYYYHFDGLGSVTDITDSTGTTVESYSYDVYGEPNTASSIDNPYLFTGRRYDTETGLYYYRARYYSPKIGRFLQKDKIGFYAGNNLYTYVDNNPVNWVDPLGLCKDGAPGGIFLEGQWPPKAPDTTPEKPKAKERPKKSIPDEPTPKDPTPKEPTTEEEPEWLSPAKIIKNVVDIIKGAKELIKGGGKLLKGPQIIIPKPVLEQMKREMFGEPA